MSSVPFPPKKPVISGDVPGPNSKKIVERDTRAMVTMTKTAPVVAKRALGCWVEDFDGNVFLDYTSGIGVVNTGYSHPKVVQAIKDQAEQVIHFAGTDYYNARMVELAERLIDVTPGTFQKRVFYTNSGTESVEAALKITRYHQDRSLFLAFYGAFHGRTMGSLGVTASKPVHRRGFFPQMPGGQHAVYPNPYRNIWGIDGYAEPEELVNRAMDFIEGTLFAHTIPADDVAAVFCEPVQGEGGYIVPPKQWFPALRKLCDEHGILLVADEVQTGFGRTGKMFASDHFGVAPDVLTLAKGIGSGMPLGAVVIRSELDFDVQGAHSNTYGGNALACAAGLATIDVIESEGLVANSAKQGEYLHKRLRELQDKFDAIGDVRGLGLMQATEFVSDRTTKAFNPKLRNDVTMEAFKRGLVLLPCGKSSLRYIPPLTVSAEEIDAGMDVLEQAMRAAGA